MKKLAVLSIALLMLTTLVFAEVMVEPKVAFKGSGTLTWGIDLDTTANHGFKNEATSNLTVTLVAKSTETKGGAEGDTVFGYIALKDMALVLDTDNNKSLPADMEDKVSSVDLDGDGIIDGTDTDALPDDDVYVFAPDGDTISVPTAFLTAPTVEAYVMLGPAKWFIYAAPDLAISYAAVLEDDADDNFWAEDDESNGIAADGLGDFGAGATGVEIAAGPVTIDALIATAGDWTAAASYGVGLKAALAVGPATIKAGVSYPFTSGILGLGASLGLTAGPATIAAGFDMTTDAGTPMEVAGGVTLALPDVATITANAAFGITNAVETWGLDAEVGATLSAVPNLTFSTLVGLWDITSALEWGIKVDGAYKIAMGDVNHVTPGVTAYVSTENGADLRITLIGKVTAVLIPNTTFVLTYTDKDLTDSTSFAGSDRLLTFATTVAY